MFFGNVGQLKERLKRIEIHGDLGIHPGEEPRNFTTSIIPAAPASNGDEAETLPEENGWEDQTIQTSPCRNGNKLNGIVFDMKSVSYIDAR